MTPGQQISAEGFRGFAVAAGLLVVLILGLLIVPKRLPKFAAWPHARTLAFAWVWLVVAWAFNAASLCLAGRERFALSWACYGLSGACRAALLVVVVWRAVAVARSRAIPRTSR